jgi:hypothetical protein
VKDNSLRWYQLWRLPRQLWIRFRAYPDLVNLVEFWAGRAGEWQGHAFHLAQYAPKPTCRLCGSDQLVEDPAGYYWHAERFDGAPLCCLVHPESLDRQEQGPEYGQLRRPIHAHPGPAA